MMTILSFPPSFSHITSQIGMFSYVGLTKDQCVWLQKERSIYLLKSSRISMCGVTPDNIDYVAKAISEAVARGQEVRNSLMKSLLLNVTSLQNRSV